MGAVRGRAAGARGCEGDAARVLDAIDVPFRTSCPDQLHATAYGSGLLWTLWRVRVSQSDVAEEKVRDKRVPFWYSVFPRCGVYILRSRFLPGRVVEISNAAATAPPAFFCLQTGDAYGSVRDRQSSR